MYRSILALMVVVSATSVVTAQTPTFTRTEDVIYGRKHGVALTMDVFTPKEKANGAGVIFCVSGGWVSSHDSVNAVYYAELLKRGYVVFAVVHGSQPKFTIPEVLEDMHRAVRYIRHNAAKYNVDPERLGISGASAGGHLSLMQGNAPKAGDPKAKDPVDRQPSKVCAIACFFPPTDFLNYGKEGVIALGRGPLTGFRPPFDFRERDAKTNSWEIITDEAKRTAIGKEISPVYHVCATSAPALIIHGDKDKLVPIQQAELVVAAYKKVGVPCELVTKVGGDHGWAGIDKDIAQFADWFDKYLPAKAQATAIEHTKDAPDAIKKALAAKTAVLIDVRELKEWDAGHLQDAALLPLSKIKAGTTADELAKLMPKGKVVYLHCKAGGRCVTAAEILSKQGYDVRPLKDGYDDLVKLGFPKTEEK